MDFRVFFMFRSPVFLGEGEGRLAFGAWLRWILERKIMTHCAAMKNIDAMIV